MITDDRDMRHQVARVLDEAWGTYDISAIVEDIQQEYGLVSLDEVGDGQFWQIVEKHETV